MYGRVRKMKALLLYIISGCRIINCLLRLQGNIHQIPEEITSKTVHWRNITKSGVSRRKMVLLATRKKQEKNKIRISPTRKTHDRYEEFLHEIFNNC